MTVITMSRRELGQLQVLVDLADGRADMETAAALLGVGRRQAYRLLDRFRRGGAEALVSRRRGTLQLRAIADRIVDLLPITRACWYHRDQRGSWSLKAVLPTIAPELDYGALEVKDGGAAQDA